jgi:hypothetical protein
LTINIGNRARIFESKELRRIFGPKLEKVVRGLRKIQNGELHYLYYSRNTIKVIKSRMIRWLEM